MGLLELRDADGASMVSGIMVPWGERIVHHGMGEEFQRGAFRDWFSRYPPGSERGRRVALNVGHKRDAPIGVLVATEDRVEGQWGEFRLASTERAAEAAQLVRDGVLGGMSVEFFSAAKPSGETMRIRAAELHGVALVASPAYDGAVLTRSSFMVNWGQWVEEARHRLKMIRS